MATEEKTSKKDQEVTSIIEECLSHSSLYAEDRARNWELYEGVRKRPKQKHIQFDHVYRSHIPARLCEQLATFATQALTNEGGNIFRIADYNNVEVARQAAAATHLLNYYMNNIGVDEELYKTLFEAECFGTGIMEVEYKTLYTRVPDEEKATIKMIVDKDGKFQATKASSYKDVPYLKQPFLRQVRLIDFWADKQATGMNDLRYACVREVLNYTDIKKSKEKYDFKNLDKAKKAGFPVRDMLKNDNAIRQGHRKRDTEYDVEVIQNYNESSAGQNNPKVELIRVFRPGTVQFVMNGVVISDEIIIYEGVRFPFVLFRNDPKPGEFYGRSSIELIKNDVHFNEEMNSLIHDQYLRSLAPIYLVDGNAFMANQLKEYKNASAGDMVVINGLSNEAIREVTATPPNPGAIAFAQSFEQSAKDAVAVTPMMDGGTDLSSGIRSQGSFELIARMGSTRIQNKIRIYAKALEDVGRLVLQIAKIFADEAEYIAITGALGDTAEQWIDPRSIDTRVKFKVKLGQIADPARATKMAQQMAWLQQAQAMDPLGLVRTYKGMVEAAATGDLFEDSVGLIETDPAVVEARAFLQTQLAGLEKPGPSMLGSLSSMQPPQQAQPPQQEGQPQPAQASGFPQPLEGN
jgi:hypothetical protein